MNNQSAPGGLKLPNEQKSQIGTYKQLVHYYALETEDKSKPKIFESSFPMPSSVALQKINEKLKSEGKSQFNGRILRVTYDLIGRQYYLPELEDTSRVLDGSRLSAMFAAVKIQIEKDYGDVSYPSANAPIPAEPGTTFRIKKISDFPNAWSFIKRAFPNIETPNLPVIEANLSKMPTTVARIRPVLGDRKGAYISPRVCSSLAFMSKNRDNVESMIHNQSTPFILIDISPDRKTSFSDKESAVLSTYKEVLDDESGGEKVGAMTGAQFYSIEIMMYMGWSVEEICNFMISTENTNSAAEAVSKGAHILLAAQSLSKSGFKNPAERPYYYSFVFGKNFPLSLSKSGLFTILSMDSNSNWVTIRSFIFLSDGILRKCFDSQSEVIRGQADPKGNVFYVNNDVSRLREESNSCYWAVVNFARSDSENKDLKFKVFTAAEKQFQRKTISMYPQAEETLIKTCERFKTSFDDIEVIVGPWMQTQLSLTAGFVSREIIEKKGLKIPLEIVKGLFVYPPFIVIDTKETPSVPDRTNFLIHEYQHYINLKTGKVGVDVEYDTEKLKGDTKKFISDYLGDYNEELAHIEQVKNLLATGMSRDDIVNFFVPAGLTDLQQVALAAKYYEFADKAYNEMLRENIVDEPSEEDFNAGEQENPRAQTPGRPQMGDPQGQ